MRTNAFDKAALRMSQAIQAKRDSMNATQTHTPTPWRVGKNGFAILASHPKWTAGAVYVAVVDGGWDAAEARANARTIVRAVNTYAGIRAALENLIRAVNVKEQEPIVIFAAIEQAKAALAM